MAQQRRKRRRQPLGEDAGFEQVLERLEEIVAELEAGELPLEDSLSAFEEGVGLTRRASRRLDDMERRIEVLTREDRLEPLAEESDADDE